MERVDRRTFFELAGLNVGTVAVAGDAALAAATV